VVGDVGRQHDRASTGGFNLAARALEPVAAAREETDIGALPREGAHRGAAYAG
jgi:hypothetical protein